MSLISYISNDEFVSVKNVLREHNAMKEEIKKSWNFWGIYFVNMVDTSRKTYKGNGI